MLPNSLGNIELQRYYQNEPRFRGVCLRKSLLKNVKDGLFVINFSKYYGIVTYWVDCYILIVLALSILQKKEIKTFIVCKDISKYF